MSAPTTADSYRHGVDGQHSAQMTACIAVTTRFAGRRKTLTKDHMGPDDYHAVILMGKPECHRRQCGSCCNEAVPVDDY